MLTPEQILKLEPSEVLGDWHPLVRQLGSTEGLVEFAALAGLLEAGPVDGAEGLATFLRRYQELVLFPLELPAIERAYHHAAAQELRELVAYDRELVGNVPLRELASASRRVGAEQLRRLRPLRDSRLVQRYLRALDEGQANAWHTLVYGVTLSVYSLPLRPGLVHYGAETLRGFVQVACRTITVSERRLQAMLNERFAVLVQRVEQLLQGDGGAVVRLL